MAKTCTELPQGLKVRRHRQSSYRCFHTISGLIPSLKPPFPHCSLQCYLRSPAGRRLFPRFASSVPREESWPPCPKLWLLSRCREGRNPARLQLLRDVERPPLRLSRVKYPDRVDEGPFPPRSGARRLVSASPCSQRAFRHDTGCHRRGTVSLTVVQGIGEDIARYACLFSLLDLC